jgi:hypothetical protein
MFVDMGLAMGIETKGGEVETEGETMNETGTDEQEEDEHGEFCGCVFCLLFSFSLASSYSPHTLNVDVDARVGSMTTPPLACRISYWFRGFPLSALASHRMYITTHSSRLPTLRYLFLSTYTILLHYLLLPLLLIAPPSYRGYSRTMVHPIRRAHGPIAYLGFGICSRLAWERSILEGLRNIFLRCGVENGKDGDGI